MEAYNDQREKIWRDKCVTLFTSTNKECNLEYLAKDMHDYYTIDYGFMNQPILKWSAQKLSITLSGHL